MEKLIANFHWKSPDGRLVFVKEAISEEIMSTARSVLEVKPLFLQSKGLKSRDVQGWELQVNETEWEDDGPGSVQPISPSY